MKTRLSKNYRWIIVAFFFGITGCKDDNSFKKLPLTGQWVVKQVDCDAAIQSAWNGQTITFTQISIDSGTYQFPDTPYDSIWNNSGSWKIGAHPNDLLLYRFVPSLEGTYVVEGDLLAINILLPYSPVHPSASPFILPVPGNWHFQFERK